MKHKSIAVLNKRPFCLIFKNLCYIINAGKSMNFAIKLNDTEPLVNIFNSFSRFLYLNLFGF